MKEEKVKQNAADIYDYVYSSIVSGKFPMGSVISESEIAEKFQISRSPIREVLKKLEGEGFVTHVRNRGTFVINLSIQDIVELYDVRMVLETYAVRETISHLQVDMFEELDREFSALNQDSSVEEYHSANQKLHRAIIRGSGNSWLERLYDLLNARISVLNIISTRIPEDFVESRQEHLNIIHSILNKDIREAEWNITNHLMCIKKRTIDRLLNRRDSTVISRREKWA